MRNLLARWRGALGNVPRRRWPGARVRSDTWVGVLAEALTQVLRQPVAGSAAPACLQQLSGLQLLQLDQTIRRAGFWVSSNRLEYRQATRRNVADEQAMIEACLFSGGCDASGYVREEALCAFRRYAGRFAYALALIRCDDWVDPVRRTAAELLATLLDGDAGAGLWDHVDLLIALHSRTRIANTIWPRLIEPALLAPQHTRARWSTARTGSTNARMFAYSLIVRCQPELADAARLEAIQDPDPRVARWALLAPNDADRAPHSWLLTRRALQHPQPSVRVLALRQPQLLARAEAHELLQSALFDPAAPVRRVAAFLLRCAFRQDTIGIWRHAMHHGTQAESSIALQALAPFAEAADSVRIAAWLHHPSPTLRASALRGLAQAKVAELPSLLAASLLDPAPSVVRQALQIHAEVSIDLSVAALLAAYAAATNDVLKAVFARAAVPLEKWQGLGLLLDWCAATDPPRFERRLRPALERWLAFQHRRFTPLRQACRDALQAALAQASARHPGYRWDSFAALLWQGHGIDGQ